MHFDPSKFPPFVNGRFKAICHAIVGEERIDIAEGYATVQHYM